MEHIFKLTEILLDMIFDDFHLILSVDFRFTEGYVFICIVLTVAIWVVVC